MSFELYEKKLASSGLTLEDGEKLGFKHLTAEQVSELGIGFDRIDSLYIPYYNPTDGKPFRFGQDTGNERDYFRVRILEDKEAVKKGSLLSKIAPPTDKPPYRQPLSAPNLIYYPNTLENLKWTDVINDVDKTIIITEGELKAAKTCKVGLPCIAVAGVYNWKNNKVGTDMIESLKMIRLRKRTIYIAFDSDMVDKPQIRHAMLSLAYTLINHGARVLCVTVPKKLPDGKKTGLDDYFVHFEPSTNETLVRNFKEECLDKAELIESWKELTEMNDRYVCVNSPSGIFDTKNYKTIKKGDFINNNENKMLLKRYMKKNKETGELEEKIKQAPVPNEWLRWPHRRQVETMAYEPGQLNITEVESQSMQRVAAYNTWVGWGCEPQEGDIQPFLDLVNYLCETTEKGTAEWFLKWLAYPIQNPGGKLNTAVVLYGREGAGKGSIGKLLKKIYGTHFRKLNNNAFQDKYTGWGLNTSFLFADDLAAMKAKDLMSELKLMITEEEFPVREMFRETFNVNNHVNIILTTNNPDALKMAADDRRFTVIQTPAYQKEKSFYKPFYTLLNEENGAAKIMHYLLSLDLSEFDPQQDALKSSAKETLKGLAASDLNRFISDYIVDDDCKCDFASPSDILALYRRDSLATQSARSKINLNSVVKEFEACRFSKLLDGKQFRAGSAVRRFYAFRNIPKWVTATEDDIKEHIKLFYKPIDIEVSNQPPLDSYDTDDF